MRVKPCHGFIKNKNFRLHCKHSGNCRAPLLPSRKLKRRFFKQLLAYSRCGSCGVYTLFYFILRKAHVFRSECNILIHGFLKKLIFRILKHQSHHFAHLFQIRSGLCYITAVYNNSPRGRRYKCVKMLNKSGFSRACVTYNRGEASAFYLKIYIFKRSLFKRHALLIYIIKIFYLYHQIILLWFVFRTASECCFYIPQPL